MNRWKEVQIELDVVKQMNRLRRKADKMERSKREREKCI